MIPLSFLHNNWCVRVHLSCSCLGNAMNIRKSYREGEIERNRNIEGERVRENEREGKHEWIVPKMLVPGERNEQQKEREE